MATLHPLTAVRDALVYGVQVGSFGFFAGMMGASFLNLPVGVVFVLAPAAALVGAAFGVARYAVFEYELGAEALHITSGVVRRQQREIPLRRIQNVDVERSVLQRLLGLAVVRFETAGGGSTEAVLRMVGRDEAERLQAELRRRKRGAAEGEAGSEQPSGAGSEQPSGAGSEQPSGAESERSSEAETGAEGVRPASAEAERPPEGARSAATEAAPAAGEGASTSPAESGPRRTELFALSTRDLLALSALTFRWGTLPVLLFFLPFGDALFGLGKVFLAELLADGAPDLLVVALLAAGLAALALAAWLLSGAITFVNYYGFRLARVDDELVYERGLLQRYSGSIPLDKVQTVTVTENALMRQFGYAALTVETAGYAPGSGSGRGTGGFGLGGGSGDQQRAPSAVPLAPSGKVLSFVEAFEGVEDLSVERPPKRARRRFAGRYALAALGLTALALAVQVLVGSLGVLWALPLAGLLLAPPAAHLKWRHLGHRVDDEHFLGRAGFWRRTTRVVPHYRLQTVHTERTVFQRRWNLGSVVADTAASGGLRSRDATAHDVDRGTADDLHEGLRERLRTAVAERRSG